jgi:D-alanyl-D-alanine carboxypeptidase/D-alanyl-D-alanine-endopeptidase (penicillin-binding protein 4)
MRFTFLFFLSITLFSCSVSKQFSKKADAILLKDTAIMHGNIGISIYEPATNKYLYRHNAESYFTPASNTKLFTLYAGMKYLGDSLVGLRYDIENGYVNILGTGDPTFLLSEFKNQPVFDFLKAHEKVNYSLDGSDPRFTPLGKGWSWDDYLSSDAAERSEMPVYGNLVKFFMQDDTLAVVPPVFYNQRIQSNNITLKNGAASGFNIVRPFEENIFQAEYSSSENQSKSKFSSEYLPFKTISGSVGSIRNHTFLKLLEDTLHKKIGDHTIVGTKVRPKYLVHSQPTDSLFKPMMHRSDNFFAEQTLLMASNEHLGYMSDEDMIDTLLKTDLKDIPQRPKWVDGSGLSRYNLFTPNDFAYILGKLKNEFGFDRIKNILATGGEGTLKYYFKKDSGFIYAKTGTLSNNCALSGYLITKKNKLLIFSVLTNNYITSSTPVRKAVEKYIEFIRENY